METPTPIPINTREHEEFRRTIEAEFSRIADENNRQNKRLSDLENEVKENRAIITSIHDIQRSLETICKELTAQGVRLKTLEDRDGQKWRGAVKIVFTALVSALVGWFFGQLGLI
ncbi:MAG: hypothetical protein LUC30_08420 [Clostridiales bacterium]|nr:hypothetical protein [Clostridiales bacterium]